MIKKKPVVKKGPITKNDTTKSRPGDKNTASNPLTSKKG